MLVGDATLIGLDLGTKTIGVAVSDLGRRFASPLSVIRRTKFKADAAALVGMIEVHRPAAVVIGLPVNMDGSEGPRAQATRAFARNLAALIAVPIVFWDERLSTAAVTRTHDRGRSQPQTPGRGRRQDGRRLHPAGGARPPRAALDQGRSALPAHTAGQM